jgi:hypothetical protein
MNRLKLWIENMQLDLLARSIIRLERAFDKMNGKLLKTINKEEELYEANQRRNELKIIEIEDSINKSRSEWVDRKMELNNKREHVLKVKKVLGGE